MAKSKPPTVCRCQDCGGTNVQQAYWVAPNTDEVIELFGSWCNGDNSWCEDCGDHTEITDKHTLECDLDEDCMCGGLS